jgi:hypothetical protein
MTLSILHRKNVLVLNRHWLPVSAITPADAFCHMVAGTGEGLLISPGEVRPLAWADWLLLPVGDGEGIGVKGGKLRVPTVILLRRFAGLPMCRPSFGFRALWMRDGGRCQYSGRKLALHEADIDHVFPRSRGGRDEWENCVISDRNINRRKAARTPDEAGLSLIRNPTRPRPVPVSHTIENTYQINDWKHFLLKERGL